MSDFVNNGLPSWAQVRPGMEEEATLARVEEIALGDVLDEVLSWINHPEYVSVEAVREGEIFTLTSSYRGTEYEAQALIEGEGLTYVKPWGESRAPRPPLYGVKMTLPNCNGKVEVLLTENPGEEAEYNILSWGRAGTMYDGAEFENIPGAIAWNEGESQEEFRSRAHKEFLARIS
jgi:hypothetical protein